MIKYISKKSFRNIFAYIMGGLTTVMLLMAGVGVIYSVLDKSSQNTDTNTIGDIFLQMGISFGVLFGIIFLFCILSGYLDVPKQKKRCIQQLQKRGLYEQAEAEFDKSSDKDNIMLATEQFIYIKGQGVVLPIVDIVWMYIQQINVSRAGGSGQGMNFRYWIYDKDGKEYTAVYTYDLKKLDCMKSVFFAVRTRNPQIMMNYSKENEQKFKEMYKKNKE